MLRKGGIGVLKEFDLGERRVAITPSNVNTLVKLGLDVRVESGAGIESGYSDKEYESSGATIGERASVWNSSVVTSFSCPSEEEVERLENRTLLTAQPIQPIAHIVEKHGGSAFSLSHLQRTQKNVLW